MRVLGRADEALYAYYELLERGLRPCTAVRRVRSCDAYAGAFYRHSAVEAAAEMTSGASCADPTLTFLRISDASAVFAESAEQRLLPWNQVTARS